MSDKTVAQKLMIKEGRSVLFVNPPRNYKSLLGQLPRGVKVVHGSRDQPISFKCLSFEVGA